MRQLIILSAIIMISGFAAAQQNPKFELRGLWVATVKNIDWPSKPNLSGDEQKREAIAILDKAVELNLNTIFLQIRPASDAFYFSKMEPLSIYLTTNNSQSIDYDPLTFWIDEAHKRALELHAWINPFRASMSLNDPMDSQHPVLQHPDWFIAYDNKWQYDPGNPACREHIGEVVQDIISRYDVDGIHMDDYFYPYPKAGLQFNDSLSFTNYNNEGFKESQLADWRRSNVDKTIELIHNIIKNQNRPIEFGISPFGVWRNKSVDARGSDTKAGVTNYDDLYADVLKWMKNSWIDYVTPQIYWDMNHPAANFKVLTDWWNKNSYGKNIYIGHALYRVNSDGGAWQNVNEIPNQIDYARRHSNLLGSVFFSSHHLNRDLKGLQDSLIINQFKYLSLIPVMDNSDSIAYNDKPLKLVKRGKYLKWNIKKLTFKPARYVVYAYNFTESNPENNARNIYAIISSNNLLLNRPLPGKHCYFKVAAIDASNNERCLSFPKSVIMK